MRTLVLLVLGVLASGAAPIAPAQAAPPQVSSYVIAQVPDSEAGGTSIGGEVNSLPVSLCISNDSFFCAQHQSDSLTFPAVTAASAGNTVWAAANTGFANFTAAVTDGVLDTIVFSLRPDVVLGGPGYGLRSEPDFFGSQVGPSGVDLAGYEITGIGFRIDSVTITHPFAGWTDFAVSGAFVFMGKVGSIDACRHGGWQELVGPAGQFENQGACVRTALG